jgi:murein DD-endopeptidase MepM/ murein hydrolase activator NlpD
MTGSISGRFHSVISRDRSVFHVGEDSGWELEGLPVHSITDGYVVLIQHESSWGTLIAIESRISKNMFITTFYGHISECIDVTVGDFVTAGSKIEIGAALTLANGGYRPHLHLGISPVEYEKSLITGFYSHTKYWLNPVSFLYKNVKIIK